MDNLAFRTYDEQSLAGKILHVGRDGKGLPGHPFCPADTDVTHVCTKLYAKGFRNPYRFHLRSDGPPIVGDVQWDTNEELDVVRPGGNYGWPCWEARNQTPGYKNDQRCASVYAAGGDSKPLHYYPHVDGSGSNSSAIVGGPEYGGTDFPPEYRSNIYFGDYAKGTVNRIKVDAADNCVEPNPQGGCVAHPFATGWFGGVDLQTGAGRRAPLRPVWRRRAQRVRPADLLGHRRRAPHRAYPGNAALWAGSACRAVQLRRVDRSRRPAAELPVGLWRRLNLDRGQPQPHVPERGHVHRPPDSG